MQDNFPLNFKTIKVDIKKSVVGARSGCAYL
jgi:hypothetical protein